MKPFVACFLAAAALMAAGAPALQAQDFTAAVKSALSASQPSDLSVQGADKNWFFLRKELEHLANGDLAAADMAKVNKEGTDPIPAITKYAQELKALGVELLLVPVPPKAAIYPEKLNAGADAKTVPSLLPYYEKLKAAGVEVLDLETVFKAERAKADGKQLYCATDSHWSPHACQIVAKLLAEKLKANPAISQAASGGFATLPVQDLEFHGDLLTDAQKASVAKEKLPMQRAGKAAGADVTTVESDPASPVLVMGDSHLQVFRRGGAMLAQQGGFVDHLQAELGSAVEEFSMQAGGADGPRREIARATVKNPDFWAKKKVVVWVFTAREFSFGKWNPAIPAKVVKKS
jgi:alginate O-acetyltransferase complex protein AlgJ